MLSERLDAALAYARRAHGEQLRKGTRIPYIAHPLVVAGLVLAHGGDEDQAIAALLHDVIEDCAPFDDGVPHAEAIEREFGARVVAMVLACTDASAGDKSTERGHASPEQRLADWYARKRAYLAHLAGARPDALLVSACDKLHNARAIRIDLERIGGALFDRFNAGRAGTLWYYRELADRFTALGSPAAAELECEVGEIERLAALA